MRRWTLSLALLLAGCGEGGKEGEEAPPDLVSWTDTDGDTIIDVQEGFVDPENEDNQEAGLVSTDTDGDGTPDFQDLDSDEDGIEDAVEAGDTDVLTLAWDSDVDTIRDFQDTDADGNCILDAEEGQADLDGDAIGDFADLDDDGDGIKDIYEIGADCTVVDSDDDGTADYLDIDSDGDNVADVYEAGTSAWEETPQDTDGDGTPDYLDEDSDGDGIPDRAEAGVDTPDQEPNDTDNDGVYDCADLDADGDGLTDQDEGLSGTDPFNDDTDNDGYSDGAEDAAGTDPNDPGSVISGIYVTVEERTSVEEQFEFTLSVQMGDIAFLLDTTCSMTGTLNSMASEFSTMVTSLSTLLPDAEYGVATFDDYNYGGYGTSGDKPFTLNQQITSDTGRIQSVLSSLSVHNGVDGPESCMEGIYQTLTGLGFDQDCDNNYDSSTDVKPFIATASDAFGGSVTGSYSSSYAGGGTTGGMGFRDYALPVVVYVTDNYMRDPDSGNGTYNGAPPTCSQPAGSNDVTTAATAMGAYLIGIAVNSSLPTSQMQSLATATNSYADTDGDGMADDRLVFSWSGSSSALRTTIVNAISDLVNSVQFSEVTLEIEGDTYGFVKSIDPESYTLSSGTNGEVIDFTLTFRGAVAAADTDQIYKVTLNVLGDGTVLLDTLDIYILVPGNSN